MHCGCFRGDNIIQLVKIHNRLNSAGYIQLLQASLNVNDFVLFKYVLQQGNTQIHKAKVVMAWFQQQGHIVMPSPAHFPAPSPTEHVWVTLKEKSDKMKIISKAMHRMKVQDV